MEELAIRHQHLASKALQLLAAFEDIRQNFSYERLRQVVFMSFTLHMLLHQLLSSTPNWLRHLVRVIKRRRSRALL